MPTGSTLMQLENGLQLILHHNEKLSKCVNEKIKSHKKLSIPVPAMLFSSKSCTERELIKIPK